jgi:hypothetical protein
MSNLLNQSVLFDILNTWCNHVLGIEKLSSERVSQLADYLKNLQMQEIYNSFTFTVSNIVKQYLSYLEGDESQEFQQLKSLTDEKRLRKIDKDASDIMAVFHHPQFGNKYKDKAQDTFEKH